MKRNKWLAAAVVLAGMAAVFVPAASAASIPTNGTGTVVENTTADSSSREFFTIKTADGNVFYIVVDKTKTDDNVYLLTPVTEDSLKALAESASQKTTTGTSGILGSLSGSSSAPGASTVSGTSAASGTSSGAPSAGGTTKAKTVNMITTGNIAFLALVAVIVFAAAFYFKIYKPRHAQIPEEPDDEDEAEESRPRQKQASAQEQAPDAEKPASGQSLAPAASRSRRDDVWRESRAEEPARSGQAPQSRQPTETDAEEPDEEPEDEENMRDYEGGMELFDDPDREDK